jgi:ubiquinone/menaquinone biosynthesis C-methylase UbiE
VGATGLVVVFVALAPIVGALREYARVLRPGGTLAVTEGIRDPDFIRRARLVPQVEAAGLATAERFGRSFHYTQRFRRPPAPARA